ESARRAQRVPVVALCTAHLQSRRMVAKNMLECERLRWIVERRGAAVRIHIGDFRWRDVTVRESALHGARRLHAVGTRRSHMMRVVRISITNELGVDVRAAPARALVLLENEHCAAFTHHEPIAIAIEWPRGALWVVVTRGHRANDRK